MSTPTTETPVDVSFHLDAGLANEDPENYLVVHELMGRGQLLNAYEAKLQHQHGVEFGVGILNKGKAQKREKRPPTQIEIMAAVEREKQEKKAARKAAKEAKVEARKAAEEFAANGGNKKLSKKERRKLENDE
ncbi:uncharacterized protein MICPUCDRAFT_68925 [Micromonas pusilla CCMP1545]|uniref:Predicted protein n=1 Tax=Micromonas pusilla (strain CCMP1545) TaxID=564608 RepID=C1MYM0_MICPC|nr:uncharacterized protein MICPUCDRAFT_68925 [Micromonas pusilla CCMP1545]EEH55360.1 predicted protein [Micromonas pusilla CCMP1545]|eukprot:XP_003060591.1 predicted protein [Micromonas pusilla CCMP1545]